MDDRGEGGDIPFIGVGARLTLWIVAVFIVTLIVFVGADVYHESRFAESVGAGPTESRALIVNTLTLHAVHAAVTVLAFGVAIHFLVRRLVSKRIARIVMAVQQFRRGTWSVRIPGRVRDEIEWLTEAFRQLGPDLERKLTTFVEADRKSVVALLGSRYEQSVAPRVCEIVATAREGLRSGGKLHAWRNVEENALGILVELGKLGQPNHPATADIVDLQRSDRIASGRTDGSADSRRLQTM